MNSEYEKCRFSNAFGGPCVLPAGHSSNMAHDDGCKCHSLLLDPLIYNKNCPKHGAKAQ